ncbi:hypothetical protein [Flavivirga rizhaonensis]|uniref:Uncharacterized protein n=1 Tax=Flavivirga rizhaonensis TaxID=2559571 RepID=A0A4S1DZI3_9FLAO|nr:hypothetical protein [Flavivirga rizhaonensis]TGV03435.1 hypothetical protein EM932_07115 [Flavivirga rizhaonensis]
MRINKNNILIIAFIYILLFFTSCKKTVQSKELQNKSMYSENTNLNSKILKMLQHDKVFYNKIKDLTEETSKLFFCYSKHECSTCIDNAFLDIYTLTKDHAFFNDAIVITPELEEKELQNLNRRYDSKIEFINHKDIIWDNNYLNNASNLSLFFVINQETKVENAFIYKRRNTKLNTRYFRHLKNIY